MISIRIIGAGLATIAVFYAGFETGTWRVEARDARQVARVDAAYRAQVDAMVQRANEQNAATARRETELTASIATAQQDSEALRHEIDSRPVVTRTVVRAVNGTCPAVPSIDFRMFQRVFDCAAEPGAQACRAGASGDAVRATPAVAVRP